MMRFRPFLALVLLLVAVAAGTTAPRLALAADPDAQPVRLVASIPPLAGIAASLLNGIGETDLLVPPGQSPHHYALKPSNLKAIASAGVILWVGPGLETFLDGRLADLAPTARIIAVTDLPDLDQLPYRPGHQHHDDEDEGDDGDHEGEHHHHAGDLDPHVWLSPDNALIIADALAGVLQPMLTPQQQALLQDNLAAFEADINALTLRIDEQLAGLHDRPYLTFHDAYQYFDSRFDLHYAGSVTVSPEITPSAAALQSLREQIKAEDIACIFAEPQFPPKAIKVLQEGLPVRVGTLDPLGTDATAKPGGYVALMDALASGYHDCLSGPAKP